MKLETLSLVARIIVSGTISVAFLGSIAALFVFAWFKIDVPPGTKEILALLVGVLAREFGDMCGYWFWDQKEKRDAKSTEDPA